MQSQYAKVVPDILAEMKEGREPDDGQRAPDELYPDEHGEPEKKIVYVYRTDDGGIFLSPTKVEEDEPAAPIVANQHTRQTARRSMPLFVHFLLILFLFAALDNVDAFFMMLAPTVTVTITPVTKSLSTTATITVGGAGADVQGRVLAPLTLTQQQTVNATGHGHQDAQRAAGSLFFYNGSFASQTIPAGSLFTGADGVQVATTDTVTIPAAQPGNPPQFGQASVSAHAVVVGARSNIQAGDIGFTGSTLQVSNSQFQHGQDARDFIIVSKGDIQGVVSQLTPRLLQSEQAALTAQLVNGESLVTPSCTPRTTTNHNAGDEAASVTVLVSQTCTTVAYNQQELQTAGVRIQTRAASQRFQRVGDVRVSILSQTVNGQSATLKVQIISTWVYILNQQQITTLVSGKPRQTALALLSHVPGVQRVSITGVNDNQQLPTDLAHVHLNIIYAIF